MKVETNILKTFQFSKNVHNIYYISTLLSTKICVTACNARFDVEQLSRDVRTDFQKIFMIGFNNVLQVMAKYAGPPFV